MKTTPVHNSREHRTSQILEHCESSPISSVQRLPRRQSQSQAKALDPTRIVGYLANSVIYPLPGSSTHHPLLSLKTVIMTPHNHPPSSASIQTRLPQLPITAKLPPYSTSRLDTPLPTAYIQPLSLTPSHHTKHQHHIHIHTPRPTERK